MENVPDKKSFEIKGQSKSTNSPSLSASLGIIGNQCRFNQIKQLKKRDILRRKQESEEFLTLIISY